VDLPDDERQLLAGFSRLIGEVGETKVYRLGSLRPLLSNALAEVPEYGEEGPADDSGDVKDWVKSYFAETNRIRLASKHLAERKLITLDNHQHETDVVIVGLKLAGYDLGREFAKPQSTINPQGAIMDILISWSKNKSRQLARELYKWLPNVLPGVKPWMSEKDIDKGTEWFGELQAYLGQAKACIIIVTDENVRSSWLYYEAGAIGVKGPDVRVCPYLVGVEPGILADGPLGKFQCTIPTKDDTLALIYSLNKRLGGPHNEKLLKHAFDVNWPELEAELLRVQGLPPQNPADFIRTPADELADVVLSPEAMTLLIEASQDPSGRVRTSKSRQGTSITANGKELLATEAGPRQLAVWSEAMTELMDRGLLDYKSDAVSTITKSGYTVADQLKGKAPAQVDKGVKSQEQPALDDNDITSMLESFLAQNRSKLTSTTFRFDEMESQLNLPPGSAIKHIDKAAKTLRYSVRRKGGNTVTFDQVFDAPQVVNFDSSGRPERW
jgi:hypothetical protein